MRDDDDIWLDSLAGSAADDRRPAAIAGRAVRAAILARRAAEDPPVVEQNLQREGALVARARAEGLLPRQRKLSHRPWAVLLAAAAIGAIAVGLTFLTQTNMPAPITRGSPNSITRIHARDPRQLQQQLIQELRAAGVRARGYETFGREGIDADLPKPPSPEVRAILERHGISEPADAVLQVEIDIGTP
jgi:hypothetical protein